VRLLAVKWASHVRYHAKETPANHPSPSNQKKGKNEKVAKKKKTKKQKKQKKTTSHTLNTNLIVIKFLRTNDWSSRHVLWQESSARHAS
jgi:hypothetical protein